MIETKAKLTSVKISPKKARLVAQALRGLTVSEALFRLPVMYKAAAPLLAKLVKSAAANAWDQYEIKEEDLLIKNVTVNKGIDLKRWQPAAFGRAHPYRKHFAHLEVIVAAKAGVTASKKAKVAEVETVKLSDAGKTGKDELNQENPDLKKADKSAKLQSTASTQGPRIDKHTTNK